MLLISFCFGLLWGWLWFKCILIVQNKRLPYDKCSYVQIAYFDYGWAQFHWHLDPEHRGTQNHEGSMYVVIYLVCTISF